MGLKERLAWIATIAVMCLLSSGLAAQTLPLAAAKKAAAQPRAEASSTDALGRSTPQGTVVGFMMSARRGDYERAAKYLDTKKSGRAAERLIDELQVVLERGFSGTSGMISAKLEGRQERSLASSKELVGSIETSSGSLDLLLEKVQRGDEPPVWLFASETLAKVPEVYQELNLRSLDRYFPHFMTRPSFLWFPLWQWIYILLVLPLSFVAATLLTRLLTPLLLLIMRRFVKTGIDHHVMTLTGPLRIFVLALAMWAISAFSHSVLISLFWTYAALTLMVIGVTWLCTRLIDMTVRVKQKQWTATASGRITIIQLVSKLSKVLAVIVCVLVIMYIAGVNITAALTGLGIGGIAIAFAAQKTLENLFGGIMIISDQPIRVGDFCKAGTYTGTVESIGFRSTYIRTLERTTVSIPNGQLAAMSLENFAFRDKILFHHNINLHPETTSKQCAEVLAGMRKALQEHPLVEQLSMRVSFVRISDTALVLEAYAYVLETEYEAFLEIQESLLLRFIEIAEGVGAGMAFPAQITQISPGPGKGRRKAGKVGDQAEKQDGLF